MTAAVNVEELGHWAARYYEDPANVDPTPLYPILRDDAPLLRTPLGFFIVTRHADVMELYSGSRTVRTPPAASEPDSPMDRLTRNFLTLVGPETHRRMRMAVQRAFTMKAAKDVGPDLQRAADDVVAAARERGGMDIVTDLAELISGHALGGLMGIPVADRRLLGRLASDILSGYHAGVSQEIRERAEQAAATMMQYVEDLIRDKRVNPGADLVSRLIDGQKEEGGLSDTELHGACGHILNAGSDTTVAMIGNAFHTLLTHRDQYDRLCANPELAGSAIEECLRYDPPVRSTPNRIVQEDISLSGGTLRKGQEVTAWLGAANFDPRRFDNPERFDISRTPNPHISFSTGANFCLGSNFARFEGKVALETVAKAFPKLELAPERGQLRRDNALVHGFASLPVAC